MTELINLNKKILYIFFQLLNFHREKKTLKTMIRKFASKNRIITPINPTDSNASYQLANRVKTHQISLILFL